MKEIDNTPIENFDIDWGDPDGTGKKAKSLKQVQVFLKKEMMKGYTFLGTIKATDTPITLTSNDKVFYIATEEGDYSKFGVGNITELSIIKSSNSDWEIESLNIPFGGIGGLFSQRVIKSLTASQSEIETIYIPNGIRSISFRVLSKTEGVNFFVSRFNTSNTNIGNSAISNIGEHIFTVSEDISRIYIYKTASVPIDVDFIVNWDAAQIIAENSPYRVSSCCNMNKVEKTVRGYYGGIFDANLQLSPGSNYQYRIIPITQTAQYYYSGTIRQKVRHIQFFDKNLANIGGTLVGSGTSQVISNYEIEVPAGAAFLAVSSEADMTLRIVDYEENFVSFNQLKSLMPHSSFTEISISLIEGNYRINALGNLVASSSGRVSDFIAIDRSKNYVVYSVYDTYRVPVCYYDASYNSVGTPFKAEKTSGYVYLDDIPFNATYMRVCSGNIPQLYTYELENAAPKEDLNNKVDKNQGAEYAGQFLGVNSMGEVEPMVVPSGGGGGGDIPADVVSRKDYKTIKYGNNLLTGYGNGNGWTNSDGTYTHASGYTDPLVFDYETMAGKSYLVKLYTGVSSFSEHEVNVSIGEGELCDVYKGITGPYYVGIISKGGKLKITPSSKYTSTVHSIELYEISENGANSITYQSLNVDGGTMASNITSFWNVAIGGNNALQKLQNGSRNVAIGQNAMSNIESGERNIGIGTFALNQLKGGVRNIAIGADALYRARYSNRNVAIGKAALGYTHDNPEEHVYEDNTAVGDGALHSSAVNYRRNTVVGKSAAEGSIGDNDKNNIVAVGFESAYYEKENTVAVGYRAGRYSKGTNNVFIGASTGDITETGEGNVIIGHGAKVYSGEGTWDNQVTHNRSIVIGADAVATDSNQIVIGHPAHQNVCFIMGKKLIFNDNGTVTWEAQ